MELYQREMLDLLNSDNALKWDFLKTLNLVGLIPVAARLLVFTATTVVWLLVFKAIAELGRSEWQWAS